MRTFVLVSIYLLTILKMIIAYWYAITCGDGNFQLFLWVLTPLFLSPDTPSVPHEGHRPCARNSRTAVHYAYEGQAEVRLWRDLIEFWVYGVWFAELLIKHPRRGAPTHGHASHTPVLRYHRDRRLPFPLSHSLSLSFSYSSLPLCSRRFSSHHRLSSPFSLARWLIFKLGV